MIIPDVNLLVYAYNQDAPYHAKASLWWEEVVNSGNGVAVPWPVLQGFVRLLSGRHVVTVPYTLDHLFDLGQEWWDNGVKLLSPSMTTFAIFRTLCQKYQAVGSASTDTLIASFALEHRARLASNDTDFLRYSEIKVTNPLV